MESTRVHFTNFSEGVKINDPRTGENRTPVKQDLIDTARVIDYLDENEYAWNVIMDPEQKIADRLEAEELGKRAVSYRLRDWGISRQRYWGAPIPMIYCEKDGWNPVPEEQLPVTLPDDVEWKPTGESPLKLHPTWKNTTCPVCGEPATRETDTMDTFMCSSWYHLRYLSPWYHEGPFDPREYDYWMPVDTYTGGTEHATMHLIYTRFFHKALRDMGITEGPEPMIVLRNQGIVLGEDSEKMSKSRGNVVDPDDLVAQHGADAVRAGRSFMCDRFGQQVMDEKISIWDDGFDPRGYPCFVGRYRLLVVVDRGSARVGIHHDGDDQVGVVDITDKQGVEAEQAQVAREAAQVSSGPSGGWR